MNLRDGSVVGGSKGSIPSDSRVSRDFARGAARVLGRWTALRLAVEGGWGGPESEAKAGLLLDDVVAWFASDSGEFGGSVEERGARAVVGGGGGGVVVSSSSSLRSATTTYWHSSIARSRLSASLLSIHFSQTTSPTTSRSSSRRLCSMTLARSSRTGPRGR